MPSFDPPLGSKKWQCGNCELKRKMRLAQYAYCTYCNSHYDVYSTWYDGQGHKIRRMDLDTTEVETPQSSRKSADPTLEMNERKQNPKQQGHDSNRLTGDTIDGSEREPKSSSPKVSVHQDDTSIHGPYPISEPISAGRVTFTSPSGPTYSNDRIKSVSAKSLSSSSFTPPTVPQAFMPNSDNCLDSGPSQEQSDLVRQRVELIAAPPTEHLRLGLHKGKPGGGSDSDIHGFKQDASDIDSDASSPWSITSLSSLSSRASNDIVSALEEVFTIFVDDSRLKNMLLEAFKRQETSEVIRKGVQLLRWLGRRLSVDAQSPTEQEAAKFFQKRRFARAIMNRVAEKGNRTDTGYKSESSSSSEEDKHELDFGALRAFIKSNDAFVRFKEELEDFIYPFRNETMWRKRLWDGEEQVRFEHPGILPRLTMGEQAKLKVEQILGKPILWWPLKQPRKYLPPNTIRIIWICACNRETFVDVSAPKARNYRQKCSTFPQKALPGQPSTLPTHNPLLADTCGSGESEASPTLLDRTISNVRKRFSKGRKNGSHDDGSESLALAGPQAITSPKYMHWCVDAVGFRTILHSICMREKQGQAFIDELYRSYKSIRGWRWYLSMTTCTEINLVRHFNVHDTEEKVVICDCNDVLPPLNDSSEYIYQINPPDLDKEIHIRRAERALTDYYHGYQPCCAIDRFTQVMEGVPHRITRNKLGTKGYGIWARQGWTLLRLMAFAVISQGWAIIFATYWLCIHPGDIQNAFAPGGYSLGLVAVFIALPDVFLSRRQ